MEDDQPLSMAKIPRSIIWEDGVRYTLPQLTALLESQGENHALEQAGVAFGVSDLVVVGLDGISRYKLSGLRV